MYDIFKIFRALFRKTKKNKEKIEESESDSDSDSEIEVIGDDNSNDIEVLDD